jgi:hypothetical protein
MLNMAGEELLDWMVVLDCKHVVMLHPQMPASMGDLACKRRVGTTMTCEHCKVTRTVLSAGLWDWTVWEQYRDERWREQHLVSLAHQMGWCVCDPCPPAATV